MTISMAAEIEAKVKSIEKNLNDLLPIVLDMERPWVEWKDAMGRIKMLLAELQAIGKEWIIPF